MNPAFWVPDRSEFVVSVPVSPGSLPTLSAPPVPPSVDSVLVRLATDPRVDLTWPLPDVAQSHPGGRWYSSSELSGHDPWADLCARYAHGIGTRHLAAGGACALQHWAGRFVKVLLGYWLHTGSLLDTDLRRWWARIDESAATRSITLDPRIAVEVADAATVVEALLDHAAAIIPRVCEASHITTKLAYGSVATSCAGVLSTAHRRVPSAHRDALSALAEEITRSAKWPHPRLVSLINIDTPRGRRLTHERQTCCLIRLGDHDACATCRDLDPDQRHRRLVDAAANAAVDSPLTLAPSLVTAYGGGPDASTT